MTTGGALLVLKEDGQVLRYGKSNSLVDFPSNYRLFDSYDGIMQEKIAAEEARRQQEQQRKAWRDAGMCQYCGGAFKKSFFGNKCTQCGVKKDY